MSKNIKIESIHENLFLHNFIFYYTHFNSLFNRLKQFSDNIESRIMFNLLKHIKFYGEPSVREKLRIIHQRVKSEVIHEIKEGEKSRRDILLSSFGIPSKSGSLYARYYATKNKIHANNIVAFDNINSKLESNNDVKALIFVEDIIASGESTCNLLQQLEQKCGDLLHEREIKVFIGAICGFRKGLKNVYEIINKLKFKAEIEIIDELTEEDQCLSERSSVFEIVEERKKPKKL